MRSLFNGKIFQRNISESYCKRFFQSFYALHFNVDCCMVVSLTLQLFLTLESHFPTILKPWFEEALYIFFNQTTYLSASKTKRIYFLNFKEAIHLNLQNSADIGSISEGMLLRCHVFGTLATDII